MGITAGEKNIDFDVVFVTGANHKSVKVRNELANTFKGEVKYCEYASKPYFIKLQSGVTFWIMEHDEYLRWCIGKWYLKDGKVHYNGTEYKEEEQAG